MNRLNLLLATSLVAVTAAAHADTVINLNAVSQPSIAGSTATTPPYFFSTQSLSAGTYNVTLIDNTGNGGYNGWNNAESNNAPAPNYWQERIGINLNTQAGDFSQVNGVPSYNYNTENATNPEAFFNGSGSCRVTTNCYSSAAAAFQALGGSVYTFTLASAADVTFYIPDQPDAQGYYPGFSDNTGGVSLNLAAAPTPEPSSLILLGTGAMGLAGAVRRRFKK